MFRRLLDYFRSLTAPRPRVPRRRVGPGDDTPVRLTCGHCGEEWRRGHWCGVLGGES